MFTSSASFYSLPMPAKAVISAFRILNMFTPEFAF